MKKNIVLISAAITVIVALMFFYCREHHIRYEKSIPLMGTLFAVKVEAQDVESAEKAVAQAFREAEMLQKILSAHDAQSELSALNDAPDGERVKVSPRLAEYLQTALRYAEVTNGAFDPTLGPCIRLWRRSLSRKILPGEEQVKQALKSSGYKKLVIKDVHVTKVVPGMRIDLGAIGKGMAMDLMAKTLRESGIDRFLLSTTSDFLAGNAPFGKREGWRIAYGMEGEEKQHLLKNGAISVSGDRHQHVFINGDYYSHVINPQTGVGMMAENASSCVVVAGKTAAEADAMATACRVLSKESAMRLVDQTQTALILDWRD